MIAWMWRQSSKTGGRTTQHVPTRMNHVKGDHSISRKMQINSSTPTTWFAHTLFYSDPTPKTTRVFHGQSWNCSRRWLWIGTRDIPTAQCPIGRYVCACSMHPFSDFYVPTAPSYWVMVMRMMMMSRRTREQLTHVGRTRGDWKKWWRGRTVDWDSLT